MNSLKKAVTASLLLAATPVVAHAEDMSYRYFQAGYIETNVDDLSADADGFATRGSFGFAENFFVFTEYSSQEVSIADIEQLAIGLGGHYGLSENLDLVGRAGWTSVDVSFDSGEGGSFDESGYMAAVGLRGQIGDHVQLEAGVIYQDFGGGGDADDTGVEVLARYHFNKTWALALEYQDMGDLSSFIAGVRVSF